MRRYALAGVLVALLAIAGLFGWRHLRPTTPQDPEIAEFTQAIRRNPDDARAYYRKGDRERSISGSMDSCAGFCSPVREARQRMAGCSVKEPGSRSHMGNPGRDGARPEIG